MCVSRRSANVRLVSLEPSIAVKLSEAFIQPGGEPSEIQMQQAVNILVVDNFESIGIATIVVDHVQANHRELSLRAMNVNACRFGTGMQPESREQLFGGLFIHRRQN